MSRRWWIAALLFLATVINYVDRQVLSIVAPVLTKELDITPIEYSNILQAFLIAYTLMYLGSGFLVDRWGTRLSLAVFMVWWSVANMLHALARGAWDLGVCRLLLGIGEPGNFMAAFKAISEWYPAREKALVNGLVQAGASVGAIVAPPLVAYLALSSGWRFAFVFTGLLGFVWLAAWLAIYRHPPRQPEPLALKKISWKAALRYRQTWGLLLTRFVSDPVWWFYLFWLPKYLAEARGLTLAQIGLVAWLPYLFADLGSISGGLLSGYLLRRGWPVLRARAGGMLPFALLMPSSVLIAFTQSTTVALGVICLVTFCHMAWKANLVTVTNDLYPAHIVGSVSGVIAFGSGLGGAAFTNLTGRIVESASYDLVFILMGVLHPLAFLVFRSMVRRPIAE
jgi:ACS family hexuronate transporter-like MFS transporter